MRTATPIVYASVVGLLLACSDNTGPDFRRPPDPPELGGPFLVSPAAVTIHYGQTFKLTTRYTGNPALMAKPSAVAWTSSDADVATVSAGQVSGVSSGQVRIVARWAGYEASALVTVVVPTTKHDLPACPERKLLSRC